MLLDAVVILVVLALIGWVWVVGPVQRFLGRKARLPGVWLL